VCVTYRRVFDWWPDLLHTYTACYYTSHSTIWHIMSSLFHHLRLPSQETNLSSTPLLPSSYPGRVASRNSTDFNNLITVDYVQYHVSTNLLTLKVESLKVYCIFRPIWPSSGVKNLYWGNCCLLLLLIYYMQALLRWACLSVTCVNFLLEFIYAKSSICHVVTYLCTYWSWCAVFFLAMFSAACSVPECFAWFYWFFLL
jgi:hypothetical protein